METAIDNIEIANVIKGHLEMVQEKNPKYSMRALARDVGTSVTSLSLILQKKRKPSRKLLRKICDTINVSEHAFAELEKDCSESKREFEYLDMQKVNVIKDWYHFAILCLMEMKDFRSDYYWIGERLNLDPLIVKQALQNLCEVGLVTEDNEIYELATHSNFSTPTNIPADCIKISHLQTLEHARNSILHDPIDERHFSATTFTASKEKVALVNAKVEKFRTQLMSFLDDGDNNDEVYKISVQLFPLSRS